MNSFRVGSITDALFIGKCCIVNGMYGNFDDMVLLLLLIYVGGYGDTNMVLWLWW